MSHIEVHTVNSAREAALLAEGGLPRLDLGTFVCDECARPIGEVLNHNGTSVAWKSCALILGEDDRQVLLCKPCIKPLFTLYGD